jgi:hypothetical protein
MVKVIILSGGREMRVSLALIILPLFFWLLPCPAGATETQVEEAKPPPRTERFILIVVDGLTNECVGATTTPNISGIGAAGVRVERVSGVVPQTPEVALASIVTGVGPARHGVRGPGDKPRVATLASLLARREAATALFVTGREKECSAAGRTGKLITAPDDAGLVDRAIDYLREVNPYFVTLVLRGPGTVLAKGGSGQEYREAVTAADAQIGRLLSYLYGSRTFETSFLCVTGTTRDPPLILKAPELKTGVILPPAALTDIAPTLAYFMGVNLPGAEGLVLWNALAQTADQSEAYLLELRVKDLSQALFAAREENLRFLKERAAVQREKEKLARLQRDMGRLISSREEHILRLTRTIMWLKAAIVLILGLSGLGYLYEYRVLRRRFLLFK